MPVILRDQLGDVLLGDGHVVLAGLLRARRRAPRSNSARFGSSCGLQVAALLPVLALGGGLVLALQLLDLLLQVADVGGHALRVDHVLGAGLVDQVDRLVRQEALGDVAAPRACTAASIASSVILHLVVRLVARPQPLQDRDRVLLRGLVDVDRGEAALQRRVLLDVLAVLVERRRADDCISPRASAGFIIVEASIAPSAPPAPITWWISSMKTITSPCARLISSITAFRRSSNSPRNFEPATIAAMSSASTRFVLQVLRHVAGDDLLRQALGDRRLADAGLADDHRVVLRAPVQDLHHAPDLVLAADHRVELALRARPR